MTDMFSSTLMFVSPVLIAAIGGMICERAGVRNIALEWLMSVGAMTAAVTHVLLETKTGFSIPLALVFAALSGGVLSSFLVVASVTLKVNQLISGTGINLLSNGIALFVCQLVFRMDRSMSYSTGVFPAVWIALAVLAASCFFVYKPPGCLRFNAQLIRIRCIAILISGLLAGLAGACVVLTQYTQFTVNTINGKGFIALAAVFVGSKLPLGILGASFLFGLSLSFAKNFLNPGIFHGLPADVLNMLPYLVTLLTLAVFSRKDHAPDRFVS